jgi:hypothetical protein
MESSKFKCHKCVVCLHMGKAKPKDTTHYDTYVCSEHTRYCWVTPVQPAWNELDGIVPPERVCQIIALMVRAYMGSPRDIDGYDENKRRLDMAFYGFTAEEWVTYEDERLRQKRVEMAFGDKHELLLGSAPGWVCLKTKSFSMDLYHAETNTCVQIKNRDNTVNAASFKSMCENFKSAFAHGMRGLYVTINQSRSVPSNRTLPEGVEQLYSDSAYKRLFKRDDVYENAMKTLTYVLSCKMTIQQVFEQLLGI